MVSASQDGAWLGPLCRVRRITPVRRLDRRRAGAAIFGVLPLVVGLIAAVGNWGVARALREASREDPAIRLAYVHNLGDSLVSMAPVVAGTLTLLTGRSVFDPILALVIAAAIIVPSLHTLITFREELTWPPNVACGHEARCPTAQARPAPGRRAQRDTGRTGS